MCCIRGALVYLLCKHFDTLLDETVPNFQDKSDGVYVGLDPPDFDPEDNKPLPRKLPKYSSFAYYLGNDVAQRLPEIDRRVDILVVQPPLEVRVLPCVRSITAHEKHTEYMWGVGVFNESLLSNQRLLKRR